MSEIPVDSLNDTIVEHGFWFPTEFVLDLSWIDCVTEVVALAVGDVFNQRFWFIEVLQDKFNDFDIALLVVATNVVTFAGGHYGKQGQ